METKKITITDSELIREIFMAAKAGNKKFDEGDLILSLAFRTREELISIAAKCHIKIGNHKECITGTNQVHLNF